MLNHRLSLGKYFGIGLYVHWTFALLLGFAAFQAWSGGLLAVAFMLTIVLSVFFCVTLHEYGHALAARRYGIPTVDITLLPIGGVARLERMPRIPLQELIVAVAGPAVNVVIALMLAVLLFAIGGFDLFAEPTVETPAAVVEAQDVVDDTNAATNPATVKEEIANEPPGLLEQPSMMNYIFIMFATNTVLVLFNLIPAFPMDGGRVFRALLAMVMDYRKATFVASRVGLLCAAGMALLWISSDQQNPVPLLIALFIGYAGMAEARQVDVMESVRGLLVKDAMIHLPPAVGMDTPLYEIVERWRATSIAAMPVLSYSDLVTGVLTLSAVAKAVRENADPSTTAGELADRNAPIVTADAPLEAVIMSLGRGQRQLPVVDASNQLVGLLDLDSISNRSLFSKLADRGADPFEL